MSHALFSRSPDLAQLRSEGYSVHIVGGMLVVDDVPYVRANKVVARGRLISPLELAGDATRAPGDHTLYFDGDFPCDATGNRLASIACGEEQAFNLGEGLTARHKFSSKPSNGYRDYHDKIATYASLLAGPAAVIDPNATAMVFREVDSDEEGPFHYLETASGRAGIVGLTKRLQRQTIAIVGLGGTGSYILDHVAKTPVDEIRLIDDDVFSQHNAFRAPGAASLNTLRDAPLKVDYLADIYGRMHRHIVPIAARLEKDTLHHLDGCTFVFVAIDGGEAKRSIVEYLERMDIAFIDVGMGLELGDGRLGGILRVTLSTPARRKHVHDGRVPFSGGGEDDVYTSNIQASDLNALNAALAVIRWKKLLSVYRDDLNEHHSTFTLDATLLVNGESDE